SREKRRASKRYCTSRLNRPPQEHVAIAGLMPNRACRSGATGRASIGLRPTSRRVTAGAWPFRVLLDLVSSGPRPGAGGAAGARQGGPRASREGGRRAGGRVTVVGLLAAAALVAGMSAAAEEPATYAGYSAPGCGRLGARDRHDPAPDGSDAYIKTASFDIL